MQVLMRNFGLRGASISLILFGLLLLQGCSGTDRRKPVDLKPVSNLVSLEKVWSTNVGAAKDYAFKPIYLDNKIFTSAQNGKVSSIDFANGQFVWTTNAPAEISTGPGSDGSIVVVGSIKGQVYAFDAKTGSPVWDTSVGTQVLTEPVVAGGVVVVRTIDNRFIGLDAKTGKRRWVNPKTPSVLSLRTPYSMVQINNEVIFTGLSNGYFGLIELANGNTVWEALLAAPKGTSEIERLSDITARPSLVGSRMCLVSYQGKIGCGDLKNAKMLWTKNFSSTSGTTQSADAVFAVNDKSYVVGFDAQKGEEIWRNESLLWRNVGEPLAVGKVVIAGDFQGYLHIFAQVNGEEISRERVDSSAISVAPIASQGQIVVQTRSGTLAAYRLK
jgi:outer membrane protein assembly factor BamB